MATSITTSSDVTGRDHYITNKALAYAIVTIESLPEERQEGSDYDDMVALLEVRVPDAEIRRAIMLSARAHIGHDPSVADHRVGHLTAVT